MPRVVVLERVQLTMAAMGRAIPAAVAVAALTGCVHYRISDGSIVYWKYARMTEFKSFAEGDLGCDDVSVLWVSRIFRRGSGSYRAQGCGKTAWYDCRQEVTDAPDDEYPTYRLTCVRR